MGWARVYVDGWFEAEWRFAVSVSAEDHLVAVALGPPTGAVDEWGRFVATFSRTALPAAELCSRLAASPPRFETLPIVELVPPELRWEHAQVVLDSQLELEMQDY